MGSLVKSISKGIGSVLGITPAEAVVPPPVPRAIEPPLATADTTQASEQARKRATGGLISQNIKAGDLVPSETFLTGKKKKLGGQ